MLRTGKSMNQTHNKSQFNNPAPLCICGSMLNRHENALSIYGKGMGVFCDVCKRYGTQGIAYWHCNRGTIQPHPGGYDVCNFCIHPTITNICYCGQTLRINRINANQDRLCHSCFKYIPKYIKACFICHQQNGQCIYQSLQSNTANYCVCPDCFYGSHKFNFTQTYHHHADKSILYQKFAHSLQIIS